MIPADGKQGTIIGTQEVKGFAAAEAQWWKSHARQFYRCGDCLAVLAVDGTRQALENGWGSLGAACGACGGRLEHMGQVGPDGSRLVKLGERTPCDDRCTMATGPKCECGCGGKNHGSKLVVVVTRDAGERPTVTPARDHAKHKAAAEVYRALRDAAAARIEVRYGAAITAKLAGWVDAGTFARYLDGQAELRRLQTAKAMRTHAGRNKALALICS